MMNRRDEIYERQVEIDNLRVHVANRIVLVGAGGVGSWVAIFLTLAGIGELQIFDHDVFEIHNLNRVPFPVSEVGKNKAEVVARFCKNLRPDIEIAVYPFRFDPLFIDGPGTISTIISAADNAETNNQIHEWTEQYEGNTMFLNLACGQNSFTTTTKTAEWTIDNGGGGYNGIPQWVVPQVLTAAMGVHAATFDENGERRNTDIVVEDLSKFRQAGFIETEKTKE